MWPHAEQFNDYIPPRGMRVSIPVPLPLSIGTPTRDPPRVPEPLSFPTRQSVAPNGVSHPEAGQTKPGSSRPGGTTGHKQMEHVCFGCGKASHIQINCPQKKAKSCAAAAARIQKEADTGTTGNVAPADEAQEGETPPEDDDAKREYYSLGEEDLPQVTPGEDEFPPSQYNWDNEDDDAGSSFQANALSTPAMGYCTRKSHVVTHDKQVIHNNNLWPRPQVMESRVSA